MPEKETKHPTDFTQEGRGHIPRLAMINAFAGFGRCTIAAALPVISTLGVQVCPVPVSIMSNHLGFPFCHIDDYTPHMGDYIEAWEKLELHFDGLYCGCLGNPAQSAIIEDFLTHFAPEHFLLDPVMGDNGRAYSATTANRCSHLKKLAARADILTPNLTESCLLTDTPYREHFTDAELDELCAKLIRLCPGGNIVITGIPEGKLLTNLVIQSSEGGSFTRQKITCTKAGASRPGTGDIFASILIADALCGKSFNSSVKKAAAFVARCIRVSEDAGTPVSEGVLLERCLRELY